jgi:hypothetical protein
VIQKQILFFGHHCVLACDANCEKAWGINHRPRILFNPPDPDDYAFLADGELGTAPVDPGTYEGHQAKPTNPLEVLNKWCARECERSTIVDAGKTIILSDFSKRVYNQPCKHPEANL